MKSFEYFSPKTLEEASALLIKYGDGACLLNGGTDVIVRMRDYLTTPEAVVDIKKIPNLDKINFEDEEKVFIGACVRLSEIENHAGLQERIAFFVDAVKTIGSRQVRNRATCIGNLCNASPLADSATPLLALNAIVHIYGPQGEREIPLSELFVFVRKTSLKAGEIVTGITVPTPSGVEGHFYKLSRRKEVDLSTVCSTVVKVNNQYRVSYGAVAPTPIRLPLTEAFLNEVELNGDNIKKACDIACDEVAPIDDIRASKAYRLEMVRVLLTKNLENWL